MPRKSEMAKKAYGIILRTYLTDKEFDLLEGKGSGPDEDSDCYKAAKILCGSDGALIGVSPIRPFGSIALFSDEKEALKAFAGLEEALGDKAIYAGPVEYKI